MLELIRKKLFSMLFVFALAFTGQVAIAKPVALEWKPIKHAVKYELKMTKDGKPFLKKVLSELSWNGDLEFGLYDYEIRAIDKLDRFGKWSPSRHLVVMPASPEMISPENGKKISVFDPKIRTSFSWKSVPGILNYKFELLKENKILTTMIVKGTDVKVSSLADGKYGWRVKAVISNAQKKNWESEAEETARFEIENEKLKAPVPVYPLGEVKMTGNQKYNFKWSKVEGAEGYVFRLKSSEGRVPAAEKAISLSDNTTELEVPVQGNFTWEVQAVAHLDASGKAGATSAQSVAHFKIVDPLPYKDGKANVTFSGLFAPLMFKETSPASNMVGSNRIQTSGFLLTGGYYFAEHWGAGLNFKSQQTEINGRGNAIQDIELTARYRMTVGGEKSGYFFYPRAGIENRQFLYLSTYQPFSYTNNGQNFDPYSVSALGGVVGIDFKKVLSNRWGISAQLTYFYPFSVSGDNELNITGLKALGVNRQNINAGIQGTFWFTKSISGNLGFYFDESSLAFSRNVTYGGGAQGLGPETIQMTSMSIFYGLTYAFGY